MSALRATETNLDPLASRDDDPAAVTEGASASASTTAGRSGASGRARRERDDQSGSRSRAAPQSRAGAGGNRRNRRGGNEPPRDDGTSSDDEGDSDDDDDENNSSRSSSDSRTGRRSASDDRRQGADRRSGGGNDSDDGSDDGSDDDDGSRSSSDDDSSSSRSRSSESDESEASVPPAAAVAPGAPGAAQPGCVPLEQDVPRDTLHHKKMRWVRSHRQQVPWDVPAQKERLAALAALWDRLLQWQVLVDAVLDHQLVPADVADGDAEDAVRQAVDGLTGASFHVGNPRTWLVQKPFRDLLDQAERDAVSRRERQWFRSLLAAYLVGHARIDWEADDGEGDEASRPWQRRLVDERLRLLRIARSQHAEAPFTVPDVSWSEYALAAERFLEHRNDLMDQHANDDVVLDEAWFRANEPDTVLRTFAARTGALFDNVEEATVVAALRYLSERAYYSVDVTEYNADNAAAAEEWEHLNNAVRSVVQYVLDVGIPRRRPRPGAAAAAAEGGDENEPAHVSPDAWTYRRLRRYLEAEVSDAAAGHREDWFWAAVRVLRAARIPEARNRHARNEQDGRVVSTTEGGDIPRVFVGPARPARPDVVAQFRGNVPNETVYALTDEGVWAPLQPDPREDAFYGYAVYDFQRNADDYEGDGVENPDEGDERVGALVLGDGNDFSRTVALLRKLHESQRVVEGETSAIPSRRPRRVYRPWSKYETDLLGAAVDEWNRDTTLRVRRYKAEWISHAGPHLFARDAQWRFVRLHYPVFHVNGRTQVDLKDKWRTMSGRREQREQMQNGGDEAAVEAAPGEGGEQGNENRGNIIQRICQSAIRLFPRGHPQAVVAEALQRLREGRGGAGPYWEQVRQVLEAQYRNAAAAAAAGAGAGVDAVPDARVLRDTYQRLAFTTCYVVDQAGTLLQRTLANGRTYVANAAGRRAARRDVAWYGRTRVMLRTPVALYQFKQPEYHMYDACDLRAPGARRVRRAKANSIFVYSLKETLVDCSFGYATMAAPPNVTAPVIEAFPPLVAPVW